MNAFAALADPTRRQIFEIIARGEASSGEIAEQFAFKAPTISQHLKVLRQAGLVQVRADGQRRLYTLDAKGLDRMQVWLDRMRTQWNGHLDALERVLEDEQNPTLKGK
ncbi:MAG: winged helix-turn-helix transcriptional regulator [Anaerolineales bacterium]|nr:winged helix-turn-helix transcriptional regulator [Anaerolineales bacterium]